MTFVILILILLLIPSAHAASEPLHLSWTNNMLTIAAPWIPGEKIDVWHMEAFCKPGSTKRDWHQTTVPHKTTLVSASKKGDHLILNTVIEPLISCEHDIRATADEVTLTYKLKNPGVSAVDIDWFQPTCIRVGKFTGLDQNNYIQRSFIFTDKGLTFLDKIPRAEEAVYRGGQVYVPKEINLDDVNPRPISTIKPANGLIGCVSADDKYLLATASNPTHELFQGVIVCLHSDPRIGGLKTGQTKTIRQKIYILKNDPDELLKRYRRDFGR
ncbi:MAG TPA: hypothetical protein VJ063_10365 [Verrucomicrobiae bacterium]|nr:hypothetical protein [Verrucomicrobiae bacterium]